MSNTEYFLERALGYQEAEIDTEIAPKDIMYNEWYFEVGESAVNNIVAGCLASRLVEVHRVLDLPCGFGRVTRHLVHLFPGAEVDACDLDADGVRFCAEAFGVNPVHSREDLTEVDFPHRYDLVWVGSLFTHVDRKRMRSWITHLSQYLSETGIMVATFHGRWCESVHTVAPYITEDRWGSILSEYRATGFGYADYKPEETSPVVEGSYGVSLGKPHAIVGELEGIPGTRLFMYRERGWADHQDVVVLGKPAFDEPWPQMVAQAS